MIKKLTPKQREALEWLSTTHWTALWWEGRPYAGWPKEMGAQTFNSLCMAGLIKWQNGSSALARTVYITPAGHFALRKGAP